VNERLEAIYASRRVATGKARRRDLGIGLLVACGLFAGWVSATDFDSVGLMALVGLFLVPGVGVVWFCRNWSGRTRSLRRRGAMLVAAAVLAFVLAGFASRRQEQASRERGDALAVALANYWNAHGDFPEHLQDLVPNFVPHLPRTCMGVFDGRPFHYERRETCGYRLAFSTTGWNVWYRSPDGMWYLGD